MHGPCYIKSPDELSRWRVALEARSEFLALYPAIAEYIPFHLPRCLASAGFFAIDQPGELDRSERSSWDFSHAGTLVPAVLLGRVKGPRSVESKLKIFECALFARASFVRRIFVGRIYILRVVYPRMHLSLRSRRGRLEVRHLRIDNSYVPCSGRVIRHPDSFGNHGDVNLRSICRSSVAL